MIASQPYRARASVEFKARRVVAPLARALAPGGRLIAIHSHGDDPGLEIIQRIWPGENPFTTDRHALLRATKAELGSAGRDLNFGAYADARSLFRYDMHTLPSEISETIGTSTLFAAWNAAVYVAQIEDQRLSEAISSGAYLEATKAVLHEHGGLWFWDESYVDLAQAGFRLMDAITLTATQHQRTAALIGDCSIELSPRDELAGDALRRLLASGHHRVRQPSTQRDAPRHRRRLRPAAPRRFRSGAARRCAAAGEFHPGQRLPAARGGRGGGRAHPADRRRRQPRGAVPRQPRSAGDRRGGASRHRAASLSPAIPRVIRRSTPHAGCGAAGEGGAGAAARAGRIAGHAVRLRGASRSCAGSRHSARMASTCPVHVGVAGPASVATLAKFAIRCGIGASLRALARGHTAFARIMTEAGPEAIDRRPGGRRNRRCADCGSARLHLRRRSSSGRVDSAQH